MFAFVFSETLQTTPAISTVSTSTPPLTCTQQGEMLLDTCRCTLTCDDIRAGTSCAGKNIPTGENNHYQTAAAYKSFDNCSPCCLPPLDQGLWLFPILSS